MHVFKSLSILYTETFYIILPLMAGFAQKKFSINNTYSNFYVYLIFLLNLRIKYLSDVPGQITSCENTCTQINTLHIELLQKLFQKS